MSTMQTKSRFLKETERSSSMPLIENRDAGRFRGSKSYLSPSPLLHSGRSAHELLLRRSSAEFTLFGRKERVAESLSLVHENIRKSSSSMGRNSFDSFHNNESRDASPNRMDCSPVDIDSCGPRQETSEEKRDYNKDVNRDGVHDQEEKRDFNKFVNRDGVMLVPVLPPFPSKDEENKNVKSSNSKKDLFVKEKLHNNQEGAVRPCEFSSFSATVESTEVNADMNPSSTPFKDGKIENVNEESEEKKRISLDMEYLDLIESMSKNSPSVLVVRETVHRTVNSSSFGIQTDSFVRLPDPEIDVTEKVDSMNTANVGMGEIESIVKDLSLVIDRDTRRPKHSHTTNTTNTSKKSFKRDGSPNLLPKQRLHIYSGNRYWPVSEMKKEKRRRRRRRRRSLVKQEIEPISWVPMQEIVQTIDRDSNMNGGGSSSGSDLEWQDIAVDKTAPGLPNTDRVTSLIGTRHMVPITEINANAIMRPVVKGGNSEKEMNVKEEKEGEPEKRSVTEVSTQCSWWDTTDLEANNNPTYSPDALPLSYYYDRFHQTRNVAPSRPFINNDDDSSSSSGSFDNSFVGGRMKQVSTGRFTNIIERRKRLSKRLVSSHLVVSNARFARRRVLRQTIGNELEGSILDWRRRKR